MDLFNDIDGNFSSFGFFCQQCDKSPLKSQKHITELCVRVYQRERERGRETDLDVLSMYKQNRHIKNRVDFFFLI